MSFLCQMSLIGAFYFWFRKATSVYDYKIKLTILFILDLAQTMSLGMKQYFQ